MENSWIRLHRKLMDDPLYFAEPFTKMQAWIDLLLLANFADRVTFIRGIRLDVKRGMAAYSLDWFAGRWRWDRKKVARFLHMLTLDRKVTLQKTNVVTCISIINYDKYQIPDGTAKNTADGIADLTFNPLNFNQFETESVLNGTAKRTANGTAKGTASGTAKRTANGTADGTADGIADLTFKPLIFNSFETESVLNGTTDGTANGTTESTTDGTQHNNIYNKKEKEKEKNKIKKESAKAFERPSVEEVKAYMDEQGTPIDAVHFTDYYDSVGWRIGTRPMADWKAAARMWERTEKARAAEAAKKEAERRQREAEREKARAERPQIIIQKTERYENGTNPTAASATNSTPSPGGWRTRERDDERAERDRRFANYLARLAAETADDGGSPGL